MIYNNLITNAVKYNRDWGRIEINISRPGPEIIISVRDTGIGMSDDGRKKYLRRIRPS
jgi:signal transduction histidine kinase